MGEGLQARPCNVSLLDIEVIVRDSGADLRAERFLNRYISESTVASYPQPSPPKTAGE